MSRLAKKSILIPSKTTITSTDGTVVCKGAVGTTSYDFPKEFLIDVKESEVFCSYEDSGKKYSFYGLYRSLLNNLIIGASKGFEKKLSLVGVGYRAVLKGAELELQLGFSHPTSLPIPAGITVEVVKSVSIIIKGTDKQLVGQFAATIRALRPPEPYKGKGVRYEDEIVRRKAGKSAKK